MVNTSARNSEPRTRFGDEKFAVFMPAAIALALGAGFSTPPTKLPTGLATLDVARAVNRGPPIAARTGFMGG